MLAAQIIVNGVGYGLERSFKGGIMQNSEIISLFKQGCSIDFIAGLVLVELKAKHEHGSLNTKPNRSTARKVVEKAIYENMQSERERK